MGKVSNALQYALTRHNLETAELAEALQIQTPIVAGWLNGQLELPVNTTTNIIRVLHHLEPNAADDFATTFLNLDASPQTSVHFIEADGLPSSSDVNVVALSQLFKQTTNSYKLLLFLALLDILERRHFNVAKPIDFHDITVAMLVNAWYPHTFFRLSLGTQDKIADILDTLNTTISEPIMTFLDADKKHIRSVINAQDLHDVTKSLQRYAPFRLIIPFVEKELELRDVDRGTSNDLEVAMPTIAKELFEVRKPLYRFNSDEYRSCKAIIVHPDWAEYFEKHHRTVREWASWEWLQYMKKRNPHRPRLVIKLFPLQTSTLP